MVDTLKTEKSVIVKTEKNVIELFSFFLMCYAAFRSEGGASAVGPGLFFVCLFFLLWLHPFPWSKWVHSWAEAHISLSDWPLGILLPRTPCPRARPSLRWSYLDASFWSGSKLLVQCWRVAQGWLLGVDGALACSEVTTHNHKKSPGCGLRQWWKGEEVRLQTWG